jgi:CxxC motif-containing protein (DUF1111 family)
VLGGAGGIDTSVIRFGHRDGEGAWTALERGVLPRASLPGDPPVRLPDEANVIELRQPPTALGTGPLGRIAEVAILANEDPEDADQDGISGVARRLPDGRIGRYGWKAQIPSALDFAADALLNENGLTVHASRSAFTRADDGDAWPDPELDDPALDDLVFYLEHLGPPIPVAPADPAAAARGAETFEEVGCASCHVPELDGVPLYSDLLLHDVWPDPMGVVDQEPGVLPTEFRTPPLWGIRDTAPYLHDGSAPDLPAAIVGHGGEAEGARDAFQALTAAEQAELVEFLRAL